MPTTWSEPPSSFDPVELLFYYYYDKNNTFVFNIDYLRKVSNDGKIFIISPEYYYYYYTFVQNLLYI